MRHGEYNRRVTIEQRQIGRDPLGQPVEGWSTVAEVWANVSHSSGMSTIAADADTSVVKASIRIRPRAGLHAGMRVLVGAYTYEIDAVQDDLITNEHIDLVCRRVT